MKKLPEIPGKNQLPVDIKGLFTEFYETNRWGSLESASGPGSELVQTKEVRAALPMLFRRFDVRTMLDAPCGDFNWMRHVDLSRLETYVGVDIVRPLIRHNQDNYSSRKISFLEKDLTKDLLPAADLVFCRDCLVHLSNSEAQKVLENFLLSKSRYLLTTNYVGEVANRDTSMGRWRPLNLSLPPFSLPEPILTIDTDFTAEGRQHPGNGMSLWALPWK